MVGDQDGADVVGSEVDGALDGASEVGDRVGWVDAGDWVGPGVGVVDGDLDGLTVGKSVGLALGVVGLGAAVGKKVRQHDFPQYPLISLSWHAIKPAVSYACMSCVHDVAPRMSEAQPFGVGCMVGCRTGDAVGRWLGLGARVGTGVGAAVGRRVGAGLGGLVGSIVRTAQHVAEHWCGDLGPLHSETSQPSTASLSQIAYWQQWLPMAAATDATLPAAI
jgi:hypothetical protein